MWSRMVWRVSNIVLLSFIHIMSKCSLALLLYFKSTLDPSVHTLIQTPDPRLILVVHSAGSLHVLCLRFPQAIPESDQGLCRKHRSEAACAITNDVAGVILLDKFGNIALKDTSWQHNGARNRPRGLNLVTLAYIDHMRRQPRILD